MDIETVLIAYVQENACLYDKNNINYNNEPFVEVIWHMFALVAQKNKIEPLDGKKKFNVFSFYLIIIYDR